MNILSLSFLQKRRPFTFHNKTVMQKITPFLWFDGQAEEAANFYASIFPNSKADNVFRQGEKALTVGFNLDGQTFTALNGGPLFKFNPSISMFVLCETEEETDRVWGHLMEGGMAMMPLDNYDWSAKYGWCQDKYGFTWQVAVRAEDDFGPRFTTAFLFTGPHRGKAGEAIKFYNEVFPDSSINVLVPYGPEGPGEDGTVMYANFSLMQQPFIAMDNSSDAPNYTFNEAVSLMVNCDGQAEVDYFWEKLTANGGAESQCGWLKDPFGVSWQIVPTEMFQLFADPDPGRAQRAMGAMMQMQKIDLEQMRQAADDVTAKAVINVEAIVQAPIGKVWELWTKPTHIMQWNNASPDWHTPRAENDLRTGGSFSSRMEAKDGSFGFDFGGVYDQVIENQRIDYTMDDGRKVWVHFTEVDGATHVLESFEAESENPAELQRQGWQAILDNFRQYVESN
jgi:predicted 3-demethylubiquinone-9 3-methyltransferase (glyoxalase superfamily)/uncharacterized protein YndB with AHSA1/START domain